VDLELLFSETMAEYAKFDVREYTKGFVEGIIGVTIAVYLIPTLLSAVNQVTGIPLLSATVVGLVVGAGVLMFILTVFL